MKYCSHCGSQLDDAAIFCPNCGCATENFNAPAAARPTGDKNSTLNTVCLVFMLIGCIAVGWTIIPLLWCIPMFISFFRRVKDGRRVGVGFKVCTLLFVSLIAGIIMLCRDEDVYRY